jgi:class 3 adenylate cyclase
MQLNRRFSISGSEERLEALIEQRIAPHADKDAVDKRIWDLFGEKWAVMFTDLAGFSRGVARYGIIHFLQTIYEAKRLLLPVIGEYDGILLKVEGDSFMVIFRNPSKALEAGIKMQEVLEEYNPGRPEEEKIYLCIGLGYGDILRIGDADVFGAEVNFASKLGEDTAESGEILATASFIGALKTTVASSPVEADSAYLKGAVKIQYKK